MCAAPNAGPLPRRSKTAATRTVAPLTAVEFQRAADVSRETMARLEAYAALLRKWNQRTNLVSRRGLDDLWRRHMLDSIQLLKFHKADAARAPWLDLGSGAGFPGLVLAIAGVKDVHLVESDSRKCAFLVEAARIAGTQVTVHNDRIEALSPKEARTISARALAPLPRLLQLAYGHLRPGGQIILLKGQDVDAELTAATKCWKMDVRRIPSLTDDAGTILQLTEISRV